jgi:hypothetical protein
VPEPHVWSNLLVLVLVAGAVAVAFVARRSDLWRDAARGLVRRRPLALAVVGLYVLVALLDTVSWVGGGGAGAPEGDQLARHEPRTVIDRLFSLDFGERSYSAPLAAVSSTAGRRCATRGAISSAPTSSAATSCTRR